ncbi:MAG TPA: hypothetical protein VJS44_17025 [Pyrinomonadaceae bacterium]|nr:hypothetical protein [Pyrinomonadaceae bacterium]
MAIRRTIIPTVILAAFIVLSLPAMAAAQGISSEQWWQGRDYGRGDSGRDRRDEYERLRLTRLRTSARRLSDLSRQFERDLDRTLDRSRVDGTFREDRINDQARNFRYAADELRNRLNDSRNLYGATSAARSLLQMGARIDRIMSRVRFMDSRAVSDWAQIRRELRVISDGFGFRGGDFGYSHGL